jgi:dTMP kinase
MLYAFDRFESRTKMKQALQKGATVIADRFVSASQIHQGGKITDKKEREAFLKWIDHLEHGVLGTPRPDHIFYLRVPVEMSLKLLSEKRKAKIKGAKDGEKDMVEEDRAYLENSLKTADWLLKREKKWTLIDCAPKGEMRSPDEIHEEIWSEVKKELSYVHTTPMI